MAAIILNELPCELAWLKRVSALQSEGAPTLANALMAVVFAENGSKNRAPSQLSLDWSHAGGDGQQARAETANSTLESQRRLVAVTRRAKHFGVRAGQSVAEASGIIGDLKILELQPSQVEEALLGVAEAMLGFGPCVDIEFPDTVWVEVSGLTGPTSSVETPKNETPEAKLASEIATHVRELGHEARVAIAGGPHLARAFARFGEALPRTHQIEPGTWVVESCQSDRALEHLPITALPLDAERIAWLARLGLVTIGDVRRLPHDELASRLADDAASVSSFLRGKDRTPFKACELPSRFEERLSWDEPAEGVEPLLFASRRLLTRLMARLLGRGLGVQCLRLEIQGDASIAHLRDVQPNTACELRFARPVSNARDLERIVSGKLRALTLGAPSVGLSLEALQTVASRPEQLSISRQGDSAQSVSDISVLCAELSSDIGAHRVGLLHVEKSFRPECQSVLVPWSLEPVRPKKRRSRQTQGRLETGRRYGAKNPPNVLGSRREPTRLIDPPVELQARLELGALLPVAHEVYLVEKVEFAYRVDMLDWREAEPISRDYVCLKLKGSQGYVDALAYVDRRQGRRFLQALFD